MSSALIIIAAILTAVFLVWRYPAKTEKAWHTITTITGGFWALVVFLAALVFIASGIFPYMVLGFVILVLATLTLLFKRPDQTMANYAKGWV